MKLVLLASIIFFANAAHSCPDLTGIYQMPGAKDKLVLVQEMDRAPMIGQSCKIV